MEKSMIFRVFSNWLPNNIFILQMVMLWLLSMWEKAGCPSPVNLIEFGPGTGVMMMDMLRVR